MKRPRGLSGEEAALWARVAATVKPLGGGLSSSLKRVAQNLDHSQTRVPELVEGLLFSVRPDARHEEKGSPSTSSGTRIRDGSLFPHNALKGRGSVAPSQNTLDATWDRKLARGVVAPDFTIDLHGHGLDAAWSRLEHGLHLAATQGARVVLVVTGRPRPVDRGAGGGQRGVIRAKLLDWLASGSHSSKIAAVRSAHPRHGGAGAVYLVLRKTTP